VYVETAEWRDKSMEATSTDPLYVMVYNTHDPLDGMPESQDRFQQADGHCKTIAFVRWDVFMTM
jgi:hypothetical protein